MVAKILKTVGIILIIFSIFLTIKSFEKHYFDSDRNVIKETGTELYAIIDGIGVSYQGVKDNRVWGTSNQIFFIILSGFIFGVTFLLKSNDIYKIIMHSISIKKIIVSIFVLYFLIIMSLLVIHPLRGAMSVHSEYQFIAACLLFIIPFGFLSNWLKNLHLTRISKTILFYCPFLFFVCIIIQLGFGRDFLVHWQYAPFDPNGIILFPYDHTLFGRYWWSLGFVVFRLLHLILFLITGSIYLSAIAFRKSNLSFSTDTSIETY
jgi:hypothetical protein